MTHEQEEQELSILASFKDNNALDSAADHSVCNEDPDDGGFHGALDAMEAGLRKSKKQVWSIQHYEPGETSADFDTGLFYFFIDTSYENVLKRIQKLPSLLTEDEVAALVPKVKELIPDALSVTNSDEGLRRIVVKIEPKVSQTDFEAYNKWYSSLPEKVDGVRISYHIMWPKKQQKKAKV